MASTDSICSKICGATIHSNIGQTKLHVVICTRVKGHDGVHVGFLGPNTIEWER